MPANEKKGIPEGIWSKCAVCSEIIYQKEFLKNYKVCPKCNFHYQLSAYERIDSLVDSKTFVETDRGLTSTNPLNFTANKSYDESLAQSIERTSLPEAVVTGEGRLNGRKVALAVMDFRFIGGSMGSVVGEKVTRTIEKATDKKMPLIVVAASGGARMQEGMFSLMQMAKTSAAVNKLSQNKVPYISILTHPTTGGVTASFATLADVIIAEPGALIGFTGPRVIEQTIKQKLPEGFQTAEFLLEHGMVDMVIERPKIRGEVAKLFNLLTSKDASAKEVLETVGDVLKEEIGKRVQKIQNKLKKGQ
ncbi:MAG: acetyl-CoA carboxylase, carboxyltransferase subunit beta [Actinomycetota bacterium]